MSNISLLKIQTKTLKRAVKRNLSDALGIMKSGGFLLSIF